MSKPMLLGMQRIRQRVMKIVISLSIAQVLLISPLYAEWADEIPVGKEFPQVQAQDHLANPRTTDNLMGQNGLLYLFVRSSDW